MSRFAKNLCAVALGLAIAGTTTLASADPGDGERSGTYLSLGDSGPYGYITNDGPAYLNSRNFLGYPDFVGLDLDLRSVNGSCPGETTTSFIVGTTPDNGCQSFRSHFPLHVAYLHSQLAFATGFLSAHKHTQLVTVQLGANDGFLLERHCNYVPACIAAGVPGLVATIIGNMDTILGRLRATGFDGVLMVVNYYSLDYSDATGTGLTATLNSALAAHAAAHHAVVADVFTAFQTAANGLPVPFKGKTCLTGLLNGNPLDPAQSTCDDHPSLTGHQLLANVIDATFKAAKKH